MIISTDISEARANQIENLSPSLRRHQPALVRVLYYLAGRADHYDGLFAKEAGIEPKLQTVWKRHYADCASELFDDVCEAAKRGELA